MIKVILNALPPARIDTPSAALSVLKAFLGHHQIETTIIYWNILLDRLLPPLEKNTDATHFDLLPYLYLLCDAYQDEIGKSRVNAIMKAQLPIHDVLNDNSDYLGGTKAGFDAMVAAELSAQAHSGPLLFGISCKYEQWIPGIVLAQSIKAQFPHAKIIIGGLRNRDKAESIMRISHLFDFAIWGEGEYPLLELCRMIESGMKEFGSIPRLIYRKAGSLQSSVTDVSKFHDLDSRIFPDYDDYFRYRECLHKKNTPVIFPLESSRGCTWNACRFCVYGEGYENRKKIPEVLKEEINHLVIRYDARYFAFMDNDIVANDHKRLDSMLDELIAIKQTRDVHFIAEVIPKHFTADTIRKLSRAGFSRIHFGYEALSDRLLAKMRKKTNFSDNVFFVKFAQKYKVKLPSANIICGAIGEDDVDILESIDNLHFLRFFFDRHFFVHNQILLRVAKHSGFYRMVAGDALVKWNDNPVFHLLPRDLVKDIDRFSLFDFAAPPVFLWDVFSKINRFYYEHSYRYAISREGRVITYREYFDGELLVVFAINDLEFRILQKTNADIMDASDLLRSLVQEMADTIDEDSVYAALDRLRARHLIYFGNDYRSIVSIVDTDQIDDLPEAITDPR